MPIRKKSKWEQWFSWSHHRRRFGAAQVVQHLADVDFALLKQTQIIGAQPIYSHGSVMDLNQHLAVLRQEFIGETELSYYHASLIVLMRRGIDVQENFIKFMQLWQAEQDFLLAQLNIRWLISACDSFIDHSHDPILAAILMNAVILVNTIKAQETEAMLCQQQYHESAEIKQKLQQQRVALCDGLSALAVGTDDSLRNMRWRLDRVCAAHPLGQIVLEIFQRLQQDSHPNVYSRSRQRHQRAKTRWW